MKATRMTPRKLPRIKSRQTESPNRHSQPISPMMLSHEAKSAVKIPAFDRAGLRRYGVVIDDRIHTHRLTCVSGTHQDRAKVTARMTGLECHIWEIFVQPPFPSRFCRHFVLFEASFFARL